MADLIRIQTVDNLMVHEKLKEFNIIWRRSVLNWCFVSFLLFLFMSRAPVGSREWFCIKWFHGIESHQAESVTVE